jgi:putative ABC transport system permease protein
LDGRVLLFTACISTFTGIVFGALPTWSIARIDPQQALKAGATTTTEGRRTHRLRGFLVIFEVASCTLLLVLAGLLGVSMFRLLGVDKGFTAEHVLAVDITLPPQSYSMPEQKYSFYADVLLRVHSLPGVRYAGWISKLPLQGQEQVDDIMVPGRPLPKGQLPLANYRYVTPEYFQAMGIPLLRGRLLSDSDRDRHVAVVSASVADKIWPGENPLGKQFRPGPDWPLAEVVGVVGDIRTLSLDQVPVLMVYEPIGPGSPKWRGSRGSLVVRAVIPPASLASAMRDTIRKVDAGVPIAQLRPMTEIVSDSVSVRRFQLGLACLFAAFALLLAALGIYGVVGYSVARRRLELGIRMALGARGPDLRKLVFLEGMSPVVTGWVAGTIAALFGGSLMSSLLFEVSPHDPLTIICVSVVVLASALLACYVPARRAAKVDPMVALRYE